MKEMPTIHCLRFDDRAVAVALEPDTGVETETYAFHACSLSMAATEIAGAARHLVGRRSPESDPLAWQRLHGMLVGVEALCSMVEALTHDIGEEENIARRRNSGAGK